jgi:O-methyltransferase involved in polyketide biosynthesis
MQTHPSPDPGPQDEPEHDAARNFASISPSAYSLLLMKGLTPIPYARQAAELLVAPRPYQPETENRRPLFWARVMHFENRYWSIDQLMEGLPITNILELSSGFSFRGLALSRQKPVFYVDTDLPELITTKQTFVDAFLSAETSSAGSTITATSPAGQASPETPPASQTPPATHSPGHYQLLPLNALDESAFNAVIHRFPPGQLLILNEGLLVYLDPAEKEQLCRNIRNALLRRGGYWITGDVYIQRDLDPFLVDREDSLHQFLQQHKVEEKKFPDFETAAAFFTRMGFIVDREATTDYNKLTALPRLIATLTPETQRKLAQTPKMHAIWRLRVKP